MCWSLLLALLSPLAPRPARPVPAVQNDAAQAPAPGAEVPGFVLPDGLDVTLWAESPRLYNPTAIDVDEQGRVWVAEAVNYRKWNGRNPGLEHPAGDRIVVLEDTDGDGVCDHSTVFAQSPDLVAPLGVAVIGERVYVSCSPNLFVYVDEDGDLVPERRETFLTGFGGHDHDHGVHSVVAGPDGRLDLAVGNAGPHLVTDRGGWSLRSGSLYDGGGEEVADNKPGLVSDDGHVWTGGLILSVGQNGRGLRVLAHNFRNEYEVALDSFGNLFTADNDDDGNQSCRTLWCLEGGNHGYFSPDGSRYWTADRRPGQATPDAHWHQADPGVVPDGCVNGAGGPTGVVVYEGALLAPWIGGDVLDCDAGASVVYAHRPRAEGAGYALQRSDLLRPRSDDQERSARWFRPSDVAVGPAGELYVADWYDPGVGGHLMGDREGYGRILRVAPKGFTPAPPTPGGDGLGPALARLASPAVNVRELGRRALRAAGKAGHDALVRMLQDEKDPRLRARALWCLAGPDFGDVALGEKMLADPDPDLRITALRALASAAAAAGDGRGGAVAPERLRALGLARDPSPAVRREVLLQLRGVDLSKCLDLLFDLAERYDGKDRTYLEAFGLACAGREEEVYAQLAAELGDVPGRWDARFEGLAWRLHPAAAVGAWGARARDVTLPAAARARAADALAFTPGREAAEAELLLAQSGPDDVRDVAAWWVRHRDEGEWRAYDLARQLGAHDLSQAERVWQSDVLRAGTADVDVDLSGAKTLWLVVTDGGDGNSCDWADWIAPRFVTAGGEEGLSQAPWLDAVAGWGDVHRDANCVGRPLEAGGAAVPEGIGTHAESRIAFAVPEGALRFRARCGPDAGGTAQNDGRSTSVRFEVWLERAPDDHRLVELEKALDDPDGGEPRLDAARQLALDPRGALRLLRRQERGELAADLVPVVAESIQKNPDLGVRSLASARFPRATNSGEELPSIPELAAMQGDAARGRALFLDKDRTQCMTCHSFHLGDTTIGGHIGPELTHVREKYGAAEILDAILNPSAAIAFGYDTWIFETKEGLLYSGFLLADGARVVLEDTQGVRHVLDAEDVAARERQELSTMPEGVALGLSAQELVDLVAFLRADPAAKPRFGDAVELFDGKDLAGWTYHLEDPAVGRDEVWSVRDGMIVCRGKPAGYLRTEADYTSYRLTVEWSFDPAKGAGNSGVLLRMVGEDKVWPRSIECQLESGNAGDLWNIDAFGMQVDPARTSGRRTTRLQPSSEKPLGEWNTYSILLDGPRLEVRVNGVLQNVADWCEEVPGKICLQSEGAEIRFRNIRLEPILR